MKQGHLTEQRKHFVEAYCTGKTMELWLLVRQVTKT